MSIPLVPALLDTLLGRRVLRGQPCSAMRSSRDLRQGRLWLLMLLSLPPGPMLCAR